MRKEKSGMFKLPKQLRKALAGTLALSMVFGNSAIPGYAEGSSTVYMGDLNGDSSVSLEDANMVLKAALGISTLTDAQKLMADVNFDNSISLDDANIVLKVALGIMPSFTPTPAPSGSPAPTATPTVSPTPTVPPTATPTVPPTTTPTVPPTATPTVPPTVTPTPVPTITPATEVPKVKVTDMTFESTGSVLSMNTEQNNATFSTVYGVTGSVLKLGQAGVSPVGVQVVNPFAGKTEFSQDLLAALAATGIRLNAHVYYYNNGTADTSDDYNRVLNASTKAKAIEIYKPQVANYEKSLFKSYVINNQLDVKYCANNGVTLDAVRANIDKGTLTAAGFGITDTSVYLKYTDQDVYLNTTAGYNPANDALDTYTFPYPTWTNGLTVSTWAKVSSEQSTASVLYTFKNDKGALTIKSDGQVYFIEGTDGGTTGRNAYIFKYSNGSVLANAGDWVYVTVSIKNDGINVYYNGVKSEGVVASDRANGKTNQKYFDYGLGYAETDNVARASKLAEQGRYLDMLKFFATTEKDYSDISRYNYTTTYKSLVDFLIDEETQLYLGGDDGTSIWKLGGYSSANEGMMLDDMSFYGYPMNDAEVAKAFSSTTPHKKDTQALDYVADVVTMNEETNNASLNEVTGIGTVLTFGEATDGACGVEVKNPFSGREDLHEDLSTALVRTGVKLNAHLYFFAGNSATDASDDYHRVLDASTKAKAYEKYLKAAAEYDRSMLIKYVSASGLLITYATKTYPVSSEAEAVAKVTKDINSQVISYDAFGIKYPACFRTYTEKDIYLNKQAGYDPTHDALETYQFPYPTWRNGVSVSMWAKVDAQQTSAATLFSFVNGKGALTVMSDGTAMFFENTSGNGAKNSYKFKFADNSVVQNAGQWVYVTVSIKNDGLNIYYNGVKAEGKLLDVNYANGKGSQKYFDYGFGYYEADATARTTALADIGNRYSDCLKNFALSETDYSDISRYYGNDGGTTPLVDFLAQENTQFYLGGDDGASAWGVAKFSGANKGMQIDDVSFTSYPITEALASKAYNAADVHHDTKFDPIQEVTYSGLDVVSMNQEFNNATTAQAAGLGTVLTFGDAVTQDGVGVEIKNPFSGRTDMHEELIDALVRTGVTLNAHTYKYSVYNTNPADDYFRVLNAGNKQEAYNTYMTNSINNVDIQQKALGYFLEHTGRGYMLTYLMSTYPTASAIEFDSLWTQTLSKVTTRNKTVPNYVLTAAAFGITDNSLFMTDDYIYNYSDAAAGHNPTDDAVETYQFPYPTWTKSGTVSFWTKVEGKEVTRAAVVLADASGAPVEVSGKYVELTVDATGDAIDASGSVVSTTASAVMTDIVTPDAATVMTFSNNVAGTGAETGGLVFKSDGSVLYCAGKKGNNDTKRNAYDFKFANGCPQQNYGEWVYVTINIKNDGVKVYYNGVESTGVLINSNLANGKTNSKTFNYGFGYYEDDVNARVAALASNGRYLDCLMNFGLTTDYSDISKYNFNATYKSMVDFVCDAGTRLFIGGDEGVAQLIDPSNGSTIKALGLYSPAVENTQIAGISFYNQELPDNVIARYYKDGSENLK